MARVKRGVTAHRRHKRLLNAAEGRKGTRSRLVKPAREALLHALAYATRDRKSAQAPHAPALDPPHQRRIARQRRALRQLIAGLKKADIVLDRKILADLAVRDDATFGKIVEVARSA